MDWLAVVLQRFLIVLYVGCNWAQATTPARPGDEQTVHKLCYTCALMKTIYAENDHYAGQMDCLNPNIDSMEVSRIECDGPCAKVFQRNDNGFLLVRSCLKNCVEQDSDTGLTRCCQSNLCNASYTNRNKYSAFVALVYSVTAIAASLAFIFRDLH